MANYNAMTGINDFTILLKIDPSIFFHLSFLGWVEPTYPSCHRRRGRVHLIEVLNLTLRQKAIQTNG